MIISLLQDAERATRMCGALSPTRANCVNILCYECIIKSSQFSDRCCEENVGNWAQTIPAITGEDQKKHFSVCLLFFPASSIQAFSSHLISFVCFIVWKFDSNLFCPPKCPPPSSPTGQSHHLSPLQTSSCLQPHPSPSHIYA